MSRRIRRSWGRRALKRATDEKTGRFVELYRQGYSPDVIAATLGISQARAQDLITVVEDHDREAEEEGGGGYLAMQGH